MIWTTRHPAYGVEAESEIESGMVTRRMNGHESASETADGGEWLGTEPCTH